MKTLSLSMLVVFMLVLVAPLHAQDNIKGNLLFTDDFTTYVHRWDRLDTAKYRVDYIGTAYQFEIRSPGFEIWSLPETEFDLDRYVIEVTAKVVGNNTNDTSLMGLIFNYQNDNNFFALHLTAQGAYQVRWRRDGVWSDKLLLEGTINPADSYWFRVRNEYGHFEIHINDSPMLTFSNYDLASGAFGLYAQAGQGKFIVAFDDYSVHDLEA